VRRRNSRTDEAQKDEGTDTLKAGTRLLDAVEARIDRRADVVESAAQITARTG
jgi:hypothetical protein